MQCTGRAIFESPEPIALVGAVPEPDAPEIVAKPPSFFLPRGPFSLALGRRCAMLLAVSDGGTGVVPDAVAVPIPFWKANHGGQRSSGLAG
jgi:hypothetical protein